MRKWKPLLKTLPLLSAGTPRPAGAPPKPGDPKPNEAWADAERARLSQAVKYISILIFATLVVPIVRSWIVHWPWSALILMGEAVAAALAFVLNWRGATQRAAIVLVF